MSITFKKRLNMALLALSILCSCQIDREIKKGENTMVEKKDWKSEVNTILKHYGHRNWIVVADAAYPEQSNNAIKTLSIQASQLEAVEYVSNLIEKTSHVDANIFIELYEKGIGIVRDVE